MCEGMSLSRRHYSSSFVASGGAQVVAEVLNHGGCDALLRVVWYFSPHALLSCLPVFMFAARDTNKNHTNAAQWKLTSTHSGAAWTVDARALIRKRSLRDTLLSHAAVDLDRVHDALARAASNGRTAAVIVLRLVIVFADESSHVNAVIVRGKTADLFEPKLTTTDTTTRPFGAVRAAVRRMLHVHGIVLRDPPHPLAVPRRLQTTDDLCQTWVAAYVKEQMLDLSAAPTVVLRRLRPHETCDPLCALLRFSEEVFHSVPFKETSRRGVRVRTLAERCATTSRFFSVDPTPCEATPKNATAI